MSFKSDQSDSSLSSLSQAEVVAFWQGSNRRHFFRHLLTPRMGAERHRLTLLKSTLVLITSVAVLVGLGGTATGAPSSVSAAESALSAATADRVTAEARLAAARSRLSAVEKSVSLLSDEDEELTVQLAEARESMREFAIAAYIDGGKSDILRSTLNPTKAQALAWQSTLSAGQSTTAEEVARDVEKLKSQISPKRIRAAEELERARQALTEASNDAIQAAAFERDAEAALAAARQLAREEAERARANARAEAQAASAASSRARNASVVPGSNPPSATATSNVSQSTSGATAVPGEVRGNPTAGELATLAKIRRCESRGNYSIASASGRYRGAYQFDYRTWAGVGGAGDPAAASPAEQDYRALILLRQRGTRPWPVCGR